MYKLRYANLTDEELVRLDKMIIPQDDDKEISNEEWIQNCRDTATSDLELFSYAINLGLENLIKNEKEEKVTNIKRS